MATDTNTSDSCVDPEMGLYALTPSRHIGLEGENCGASRGVQKLSAPLRPKELIKQIGKSNDKDCISLGEFTVASKHSGLRMNELLRRLMTN